MRKIIKETDNTNRSFREADFELWMHDPLVIGIEVLLSNNHPIKDECDIFAGKYPKDFKFVGWHLGCRCCPIPVTPSKEEVIEYVKAQIAGKDVSDWKFKGEVKEMPDTMKQWIKNNRINLIKLKEGGLLPEWILDNPKYINV